MKVYFNKCMLVISILNTALIAFAESPRVQIDRKIFNESLDNKLRFLTQFRAVTYLKDGKKIGVRFFAIKADPLFEGLGIKNGDVISSINGKNITSREEFIKELEESKNSDLKFTLKKIQTNNQSTNAQISKEQRRETIKIHVDLDGYKSVSRKDGMAVPLHRDGEFIGIKFFSVRKGGIFDKIGIQSGEVLRTIDGKITNDIDEALKILMSFTNGKNEKFFIEKELN